MLPALSVARVMPAMLCLTRTALLFSRLGVKPAELDRGPATFRVAKSWLYVGLPRDAVLWLLRTGGAPTIEANLSTFKLVPKFVLDVFLCVVQHAIIKGSIEKPLLPFFPHVGQVPTFVKGVVFLCVVQYTLEDLASPFHYPLISTNSPTHINYVHKLQVCGDQGFLFFVRSLQDACSLRSPR